MTPRTGREHGDHGDGGRRRCQSTAVTSSRRRRRDVLTGLAVVVVLAVLLRGDVVDATAESDGGDVFASSEHLRALADSERLLVPAVRRYVADERQRLVHILRYDRPTSECRLIEYSI